MQHKTDKKQARRLWIRWCFIIVAVASIVYMSVKTAAFLKDAEMALGQKPLVQNPKLRDLLVNQQQWQVPADSMVAISQLHVAIRVARVYLQENAQENPQNIRREVARIMNTHMMSKDAYRWVRQNMISFALKDPSTRVDKQHAEKFSMLIPEIRSVRKVFDDNLDREVVEG